MATAAFTCAGCGSPTTYQPLGLTCDNRPEYMAGAFCESYDRPLVEIRHVVRDALRTRGWELAEFALRQEADDARIDLGPLVKITCESSEEAYRHILLPVFLVTTRLGDKVSQVVVSGIDGATQARPPISWLKVGGAVTLVASVAAGLAWLDHALS